MSKKEHSRRQRQLMREMGSGSIAVIPAAPEVIRNGDVYFPYRQDSDFFYLSGFTEPEAVIVLVPERQQGEYILFCREKDQEKETWHGKRAGQTEAVEEYGADDSFPISDINDILPGLLENKEKVFYTMGRYPDFDKHMLEWVNRVKQNARSGVRAPTEFVALEYLLNEMRLFKTSYEQRQMHKAARIAAAAHRRAMRVCKPGMNEYQVEAELLYEFHRNGGQQAYPSIVGGGANGCILHYTDNNSVLRDGDLILIDAGAEYRGYASDLTRTYPVNGEFSSAQRDLYEIVLAAQHAAIEEAIPGNHWNDPHEAAVKEITRGLISVGLLKGSRANLIKDAAYKKYYMHRTGHWLGSDVHDVGDYKVHNEWRVLEPGMAMTIEPGIYITADKGIPKELHNIGIRIEDDVLITRDANEVLTEDAPKTVAAIEAEMRLNLDD
ncbi:MAG: Xaa-Pro aminopeptidase [Gammaproteobacteria bacterium]|nr:Xaa-Pro aminopeptidase [Gammaproteobacteria bacterium]